MFIIQEDFHPDNYPDRVKGIIQIPDLHNIFILQDTNDVRLIQIFLNVKEKEDDCFEVKDTGKIHD